MGTVGRRAEEVKQGLRTALPKLRKTVVDQVALAVGAMIERQRPNTAGLANVLPLAAERQDVREQWLRRLLKHPLLSSPRCWSHGRAKRWPKPAGTGRQWD